MIIQRFADRFIDRTEAIRAALAEMHPQTYEDLVRLVVTHITDPEGCGTEPDPSRVHSIDDGDYQGTLVFVVGATGYQPDNYWYVKVSYGSCSGCDTLEAIGNYGDDPPTEMQLDEYMTLALHVVQGLRSMDSEATA